MIPMWWKRFFSRKWKENHDISNVWPFRYDRTINRSIQKLFSFDQTITKTNSNYTKSTYRSIVYYLCTTFCITIIIDIYYIRVKLIFTIYAYYLKSQHICWKIYVTNKKQYVKRNQFRISKMMAIECVTKDLTWLYFKCNGNIKWTIVVIFLSIIFLIVNSYSLESIEHTKKQIEKEIEKKKSRYLE